MKKELLSAIVVFGLLPAMLSAQERDNEKRKFGLTFPSVGIVWRVTDKVAFLPSVDFTHGWSSFTDTVSTDSKNNALTVNAALRFYVHDWKGLRFYISPKYGYAWNNSSISSVNLVSTSDSNTHFVSGAWGLEYAVSDRISLFGDIGVRYTHGVQDNSSLLSAKNNMIGTAGAWGMILYLK